MPAKSTAHLWVPPEGVLDRLDRSQIADKIRAWAGKRLVITLESPKRSIPQNAYYWACYITPITAAMRAAGWEGNEEQVHEWLARKFLPTNPLTMPDQSVVLVRTSTTTLTTSQFTDYLDNIRGCEAIIRLGLFFESPRTYEHRTGTKVK